MEKLMNLKRAFLILIAATFLPGMAFAQIDTRIDASVIFDDGNPAMQVLVRKVCNDGLPLTANETLGNLDSVTFVTTDLGLGWECIITAEFTGNYVADYIADGGVGVPGGCVFDTELEVDSTCLIEMNPLPATVIVGKSWETSGAVAGDIDFNATIIARAGLDGVIVGATPCLIGGEPHLSDPIAFCLKLDFSGETPADRSFKVITGYLGATIDLFEVDGASSVEVSDDCGGDVTVTPGSTATCDFTNTVFFEGIPTLSQYGLAIMALLMLGVGFVGFRRFV
jgi:hypothetical protein